MPPEDRIEDRIEAEKSSDNGGDHLGTARTVDGQAVREAAGRNRDLFTSMSDIPVLGPIGAGGAEGFCLVDGDQVLASKAVQGGSADSQSVKEYASGIAVEQNGHVLLKTGISNVPEVMQGVQSLDDLGALGTGIGPGLGRAAQGALEYLSTPNAVEKTLLSIGPALDAAVNYYANRPAEKIATDTQDALGVVAQGMEETLGHPMRQEEIGDRSGEIMPGFFFPGKTP